jgi:hypothetical protein
LADELSQAAESATSAISALGAITSKVSPIIFEAKGLEAFSVSAKIEVPAATSIIAALLREHGSAVLRGEAAATLPTPEAPSTPTIAPKPVTRRLFTLRSISWTNADGMLRVAQKFTDVDLPLVVADRAIAAQVCVEMNNPARNPSTHNQWPGHPDPAQCFSLDEASKPTPIAAEPQGEILKHAGFVETIGRPYVVRTASGVS